jgi:Flagellar biosynthesis protein, FliO
MSRKTAEGVLDGPVPRKSTIRDRRVKAQSPDASSTALPKAASKSAKKTKSINPSNPRRLIKPKAARKSNAPIAKTLTVGEFAPALVAEKFRMWPQEIAVPDGVEPPADRSLIRNVEVKSAGILSWLAGAWTWMRQQLGSRRPRKRLRVCESVSLGEKRFVAVIEVDGEQFLVGGASSSVATLARLAPSQEFSAVLKRRWAQEPVQA